MMNFSDLFQTEITPEMRTLLAKAFELGVAFGKQQRAENEVLSVEKGDIEEYKDWMRRQERAETTIAVYCEAIEMYFRVFDELNEKTLLQYKSQMLESVAPATLNFRLCAMFSFAKFRGMKLNVKTVKIHRKITVENVISKGEFAALCDGLKADGKQKALWTVKFLAMTGARINEFNRLTKKGLERGYEDLWTKGKFRRIYYPKVLQDESATFLGAIDGEYLFPNLKGEKITRRGISYQLKNWAKKYGVRRDVVHPHSFRHFFAQEFIRNGGDITLLSDLLGHSNLATTAIYTRMSNEEMTKEFSRIMSTTIKCA
jgi:site-specific recombinase XerD